MNRPLVAQICNLLYRRIAFCGRHKPSTGSWSQCMMLESLKLPMNLFRLADRQVLSRILVFSSSFSSPTSMLDVGRLLAIYWSWKFDVRLLALARFTANDI